MFRRLLLFAALALVAAPAALAAGPAPFAVQGGAGVLSPDGKIRYVAVGVQGDTALTAVQTNGGKIRRTLSLIDSWGTPTLTYNNGPGDGISRDGKTIVLQSFGSFAPTSFLIVDAGTRLRIRDMFTLNGSFAFDALSPDAKTMYLIQHVSQQDITRYVVRAYDLGRNRLLPGRIADRTQKSWIMQGFPVTRTTSVDGRWVYTLYQNPGGYPFVHALDTVRGVAHCVGVPWSGDQAGVWNLRLALRDGGRTLAVVRAGDGGPYTSIDTRSWRLSTPSHGGGGFPWWGILLAAAGGVALVVAAAAAIRRRGPAAGPVGAPVA
jgi:hypothetical protein